MSDGIRDGVSQFPGNPGKEEQRARISRDEFYLQSARLASQRSTCLRGQVGCVIVRDKRIVVSGYNGAPAGLPHCLDVGCDDQTLWERIDPEAEEEEMGLKPVPIYESVALGCQRAVHAEQNAINFAAKEGIPLDETSLWSTHGPCLKCAQSIITAGIMEVHYIIPYRLAGGIELLDDAVGVQVFQHEEFDGLAG